MVAKEMGWQRRRNRLAKKMKALGSGEKPLESSKTLKDGEV
jgi:hypothetical protein